MSTFFSQASPATQLAYHWGEKRGRIVKTSFTATLKKLRAERGLSQAQLGQRLFVDKSAVARNDVRRLGNARRGEPRIHVAFQTQSLA
jgi:ribosome-binding protein aMBF1 (putative translation factor)